MRAISTAVVAFVLLSAAAPLHAQSTRRPDLGVFGSTFRDPTQVLSVRGTLGLTAYDVLKSARTQPDGSPVSDRGWGSTASAGLSYRLAFTNVSFNASAGVLATYYPDLEESLRVRYVPGGTSNFGWGWDLSRRVRLSLSSQVGVQPRYLGAFDGGGGLGGSLFSRGVTGGVADASPFLPPEEAFVGGQTLLVANAAGLRVELTRRVSLSGDYQFRREDTFGAGEEFADLDLTSQDAGTALHFAVTQNLSVRGGYRFRETRYSRDGAEPFRSHMADIGVDYARGLTLRLTRNTTLTARGGASAFADRTGQQRYRLNGDVLLDHEMGRTWSASAEYSRGIDADEVLFQEPVLYDQVSGRVNGLLTSRLGAHVTGQARRGAVGFGRGENGMVTASTSAGLQTAISRYLSINVAYTLYYHRLQSGVPLPVGFQRESASQGIQAYLSVWAPIFQRARRTNAPG